MIRNNKLQKLLFVSILFFNFIYASTLNLSIASNPSRINPILSTDTASSDISGWIFNGLFTYDKDGNIIPELAHSHTFKDETTLIVKLKENVLWHDGIEFSSKDVVFTYEKITDPKIYTPYSTNYKKVKSVKALDKYTVEIKYFEPYFKALEIWMMGMLPEHALKDEKDLMTSEFNKKPIGTGPYILDELKLSQDITLHVNKNYFKQVPKIEKLSFKFVPDPVTSFYMLKQKQLDYGGLTPIQLDRQIGEKFKNEFNLFERESRSYTYLGFNLKGEKFSNKKVREALSLAINRKELADILYFGHATVCNGPFLPGTYAYNENVKPIKQDIVKAKELLKEVGYDETNRLTFTVITNANNSTRVNAAQILQYQLKKAGIDMKIRIMEWQAFLNTVVHPRKFDAIILGWSIPLMPDARSVWHSSNSKTGGFNLTGYENKKVDSLIEKGEVTLDREKLSVIYKEIFKHIADDLPYLFLYIPNSITSVNKDIKNVSQSLIGVMHNQQEWIKIEK